MRHINSKYGFTLIEILMAMSIFLVGSISIWAVLASSLRLHKNAIDEQNASLIASSIIAELEKVDILKNRQLSSIKNIPSKNFPDYHYDILFEDIGYGNVLVRINVFYKRKGRLNSYKFKTIIRKTFSNIVWIDNK